MCTDIHTNTKFVVCSGGPKTLNRTKRHLRFIASSRGNIDLLLNDESESVACFLAVYNLSVSPRFCSSGRSSPKT